MSKKLKITLGTLVIVAGFLVVRMGLVVKNSVDVASRVRGESTVEKEENPFLKDTDNDGIADYDEAYYGTDVYNPDTDGDGYLDGEEIVSLTNPTDPSDNRAVASSQNVTETLTARMIGGVYSGDLLSRGGENQTYKENINLLALAAIDEADETLAQPFANNSLLVSDDSKESQEQYLREVADLLDGPFLDAFLAQTSRLNEAANLLLTGKNETGISVFKDHSAYYTQAYTRLLAVSAPPKWLPLHRQLLFTFQKIAIDYTALTKIYDDPIVAMAGLNDLATSFSLLQYSIVEEVKKIVAKEGLELPNSQLFNVLGLLENNYQITQ